MLHVFFLPHERQLIRSTNEERCEEKMKIPNKIILTKYELNIKVNMKCVHFLAFAFAFALCLSISFSLLTVPCTQYVLLNRFTLLCECAAAPTIEHRQKENEIFTDP